VKRLFSDKNSVIYFLLAMAVTVAGVEIGSSIYELEAVETVIKGVLSMITLSLMYIVFLSPSSSWVSNRADEKIKFPRDLRYIALYFFLSIVAYWALQYVVEAVLYFINKF
jgi:hypothetical protein